MNKKDSIIELIPYREEEIEVDVGSLGPTYDDT
jgi:hypothetical protein